MIFIVIIINASIFLFFLYFYVHPFLNPYSYFFPNAMIFSLSKYLQYNYLHVNFDNNYYFIFLNDNISVID